MKEIKIIDGVVDAVSYLGAPKKDENGDPVEYTGDGILVSDDTAVFGGWSHSVVEEENVFTAPPPHAPTQEDISRERARRIALGQKATVTGIGEFIVDTRNEEDFRNLNGLVSKGIVLQLTGDTTTTVTFRDAHNVDHEMLGPQLIEMGASVGNEVDKLYKKSWALKSLDQIPTNYEDDSYWT